MPAPTPIATYRLQLNASFGFDQAAGDRSLSQGARHQPPLCLAVPEGARRQHPWLRCGRSQCAQSRARRRAGFRRLSAALARADMGLILDFVPNHMGVNYADNAWWLDVLEWGPQSPYAASFDIDWKAACLRRTGRLLLPILGQSYGEALERGEIKLRYDAAEGSFSAWYYEHRLPIRPATIGDILRSVRLPPHKPARPRSDSRLLELATAFQQPELTRETGTTIEERAGGDRGASDVIEHGLAAFRPSAPGDARGRQSASVCSSASIFGWRIGGWPRPSSIIGASSTSARSRACGSRMPRPSRRSTRLVGRLIASGELQGLRLDHIDGLLDPAQYCQRLQDLIRARQARRAARSMSSWKRSSARASRCRNFPALRERPATNGSMSSRACSWTAAGLRRSIGFGAMSADDDRAFEQILHEAKRHVLENILAAEFTALARLLARIAAGDYRTRDHSHARLRAALELFILHFPVYRTYITAAGASPDGSCDHRAGARRSARPMDRRGRRDLRFPARCPHA